MSKAERQAASVVAAYHEARLTELFEHVSTAMSRYRGDEIDIFSMDEAIHQYHRAAQELWKFCWSGGSGSNIELIASVIERMTADDQGPINWWERGAPRNRR